MHIFCKDFKSIMHLIEWRSMFYNDNMKYNTRKSIRHKKAQLENIYYLKEVAVFLLLDRAHVFLALSYIFTSVINRIYDSSITSL